MLASQRHEITTMNVASEQPAIRPNPALHWVTLTVAVILALLLVGANLHGRLAQSGVGWRNGWVHGWPWQFALRDWVYDSGPSDRMVPTRTSNWFDINGLSGFWGGALAANIVFGLWTIAGVAWIFERWLRAPGGRAQFSLRSLLALMIWVGATSMYLAAWQRTWEDGPINVLTVVPLVASALAWVATVEALVQFRKKAG
jgi:hypothetical protein